MRKYVRTSTVALFAALIVGCASTDLDLPLDLAPRSLDDVRGSIPITSDKNTYPVVAFVLGGGGLRGFAHVGALQALEEAGIKPMIVVGTSAGSVVGAAYASGLNPEQIKSAALDVKISSLLDFTLSSKGLIRGNKLANWINTVTGGATIEKFPIRFGAVATDLKSGLPVLLDKGSVGRAIQASSAVPGVNVPVAYRAGHLIDGGITSLVPVRFARAMGADIVIAVEIYCRSPHTGGLAVPIVLSNVMQTQSCLVAAPEMAEADLLISPVISIPGMLAKDEHERVIRAGYDATRAALKNWRAAAR